MMNIIIADYLRALTSAIYVFICVQVVVSGYRFAELGKMLDNAVKTNESLNDELNEVYKERDEARRQLEKAKFISERSAKDVTRIRNEKNKLEKEINALRKENRHLTAMMERPNQQSR